MNKAVRVLLVMVYLLAVSGISIVRHYCADELSSISISSDGGCGTCTDTDDDCCSTESSTFSVANDHAPASTLHLSPFFQVIEVVLPPTVTLWLVKQTSYVQQVWERGPPKWAKVRQFLSFIAVWRK